MAFLHCVCKGGGGGGGWGEGDRQQRASDEKGLEDALAESQDQTSTNVSECQPTFNLKSFRFTITAVICWSINTRTTANTAGIVAAKIAHTGSSTPSPDLIGLTIHPLMLQSLPRLEHAVGVKPS